MDSRHTSSSFNEPKGKEALPDKGLPPFSISKQFELPTSKVSFLTILLYGSSFEIFLQILGAFTAIAAGCISFPVILIGRRGVTSHDYFSGQFREFIRGSHVT